MLENRNNKNTLIQIYANLFESLFLPNIVQAKYSNIVRLQYQILVYHSLFVFKAYWL